MHTKAQNLLYPDIYSSFAINKAVLSPSYIPEEGNYGLSGVYKFKTGQANWALYDVNASLVSDLANNNKQLFRISFFNEKEGPYISSPRAYINYAYRISISKESSISAGVAFGFLSKQFSAPSSTGAGNVMLPDGNTGLTFQYQSFQTSVAMYQLFGSEGKAIKATLRLNSYYQFYAEQIVILNEHWDLRPHMLLRILPEVTNQWIGGASLVYKKQLEVTTIYTQRRGVAFQAMLKIDNDYLPVTISVLYNSALFSQTPVWLNSTELGLSYME